MNCKFCGVENENTSKYCIGCGQELETHNDSNLSICSNCGTSNEKENLYCINCGKELTGEKYISRSVCPFCSFENDGTSKFCVSCGKRLTKKPFDAKINVQQKKRNKKQLRRESKKTLKKNGIRKNSYFKNLKFLWIIVGVVIGAVIIVSSLDLIFHKYPNRQEIPVEQKSIDPVVEAKVYEIASKFVCSCGTCNEKSLEVCTCSRAIEERQFIRDYLEKNQNSNDIIVATANKYGWLKAEFASQYKVDKGRIWSNNSLATEQTTSSNNLLSNDVTSRLATLADRNFIISKFRCPCGQCNIDELIECDCQHPRGATEIKKFITSSILSRTKTVNQIINEVDNKYGGKKI